MHVAFLRMIYLRAAVSGTGAIFFRHKIFFISLLECNVLLITLTLQQQRYVLAATSVDIPECPPSNDCVRAHVSKDFCFI